MGEGGAPPSLRPRICRYLCLDRFSTSNDYFRDVIVVIFQILTASEITLCYQFWLKRQSLHLFGLLLLPLVQDESHALFVLLETLLVQFLTNANITFVSSRTSGVIWWS